MKAYLRFGVMILTSTIVMFFLMYFNVFELEHAAFSETRVYMALMMGAVMAVIMMLFMWKMYEKKKWNYMILAASAAVLAVTLWLVRSQATVQDVSWMKAMIPHHSSAILTSERAELKDPRVRKLSEEIIEAQIREIAEMKQLIKDIEENGRQGEQ